MLSNPRSPREPRVCVTNPLATFAFRLRPLLPSPRASFRSLNFSRRVQRRTQEYFSSRRSLLPWHPPPYSISSFSLPPCQLARRDRVPCHRQRKEKIEREYSITRRPAQFPLLPRRKSCPCLRRQRRIFPPHFLDLVSPYKAEGIRHDKFSPVLSALSVCSAQSPAISFPLSFSYSFC